MDAAPGPRVGFSPGPGAGASLAPLPRQQLPFRLSCDARAERAGRGLRVGLVKILIAHNEYQQAGGEDIVVANEARLLTEHGHEVNRHFVSNDSIDSPGAMLRTAWNVHYSAASKK